METYETIVFFFIQKHYSYFYYYVIARTSISGARGRVKNV